MKTLFVLLTITAMMLLTSCDKLAQSDWQNKTSDFIASSSAPFIAGSLSCSNVDAVKASIKAEIMRLPWFTEKNFELKSTTSTLCQVVVAAVIPRIIDFGSGQLPATWNCTGEGIKLTAEKLAVIGCGYIQ